MGLYDRGYVRDPYQDDQGSLGRMVIGKPMVTLIIAVNVIIYIVDMLSQFRLNDLLALETSHWRAPWLWFQYLTYGFVHDPRSIGHILFNMLGLFLIGPSVENQIGRFEFLRFYLLSIIVGGIVFTLTTLQREQAIVLGASGGVEAVVMLFIVRNPHATMLFSFVVPVKAWVIGVIMIATNMLSPSNSTATQVHLAGIAFAGAYHYFGWNFGEISFDRWKGWLQSRRREKVRSTLKVHDPDGTSVSEADEADRILDKIHQHGEASLTAAERRTLENYSRKMRERRGL